MTEKEEIVIDMKEDNIFLKEKQNEKVLYYPSEIKIIIKDVFKNLIKPLTENEFLQLETNCIKYGITDPIVVWEKDNQIILLDGHHRFKIACAHNLPFKIEYRLFDSNEEAHDWMIENQFGRRNLTPEQLDYYIGKLYSKTKKQGERKDLTSGQNVRKLNTAGKIAKVHNMNEKTVRRNGIFAGQVDKLDNIFQGFKMKVLSGKSGLNKEKVNVLAKMPEEKSKEFLKEIVRSKKPVKVMRSESSDSKEKTVSINDNFNKKRTVKYKKLICSLCSIDFIKKTISIKDKIKGTLYSNIDLEECSWVN